MTTMQPREQLSSRNLLMPRSSAPSSARSPSQAIATKLLLLATLAIPLAACSTDKVVQTGTVYPYDYRDRHPIVLTDRPKTLDVFVRGDALDERQVDDVKTFAAEYRSQGKGVLNVQVPSGNPGAHRTLDGVRRALSQGGLAGRSIKVTSYQPTDPELAAPIRLSFNQMQAVVDGKCGLWPQDLGVSNAGFNLRNEPFWNLGCATQSNFASQVADPVDLVRGRTVGAIDPVRRTNDIQKLREGNDPSTNYRQDGTGRINQGVAE
jgi:pilus assembly protein CpaD